MDNQRLASELLKLAKSLSSTDLDSSKIRNIDTEFGRTASDLVTMLQVILRSHIEPEVKKQIISDIQDAIESLSDAMDKWEEFIRP